MTFESSFVTFNGKSRHKTTRYQTGRFICNMVTPKVSWYTTDMVIQSRKHTGNKVALPELDACCAYWFENKFSVSTTLLQKYSVKQYEVNRAIVFIFDRKLQNFARWFYEFWLTMNFNLEILFLWIVFKKG